MTSINTNVGALNARLYALTSTDKQQTAMERLSSGLRVNSAADDAAGWPLPVKWSRNFAVSIWQSGITKMLLV